MDSVEVKAKSLEAVVIENVNKKLGSSLAKLEKDAFEVQDLLRKQVVDGDQVEPVYNGSRSRPFWRRFLGIGLSILSSAAFSLALALVTMMYKEGYHVFAVSLWRFEGIAYPSLLMVAWEQFVSKMKPMEAVWPLTVKERGKTFAYLILRSVCGCISATTMFAAASYLGAPEAAAITFSSPILVTVLGRLFLKEPYGFVSFLSALLNIAGLVVISRPPWLFKGEFDMNMMIGVIIGVVSMFGSTGVVLFLRLLRNTSYSLIGLSFGLMGMMTSICGLAVVGRLDEWNVKDSSHYPYAIGIGLTTFLGQAFFSLSLRFEEAGIISLTRCLDTIFAFIWQMILLNKRPDQISIGGTAIIMIAVLLTGVRKLVKDLPVDHPNRKRFSLFLM